MPKGGFVKERLPFIVATGGEFIGLYFWLYYWDLGSYALATIVLWAGFLTERLSVLGWVGYFQTKMEAKYRIPADDDTDDFKNRNKLGQVIHLLLICLSEISIWVVFVIVYEYFGWPASLAVLIIGEQLEHSMELGLIANRAIKEYIPTWNALKITLLEAFGGVLWIYLVRHEQPQLGGFFLLLGLTIEHVVQGNKIQVDLEQDFKDRAQQGQEGGGSPGTPPSSTTSEAQGGSGDAPPSGTSGTEVG
jgi:hypothetical protein